MEKPYNNMTDMLDELEETIWKCIRGPYAFWGHSMGGKIAYELEKRLEKRGKTAQCFLVSGSRIPSIPERNPIYHLPDDEFKKALGRFEGTPKEILENQELLDFFLPMLRADFTMDETYHDKKLTVLQSPIEAFGGRKDREADEEAMKEWRKYTKRLSTAICLKVGIFTSGNRKKMSCQKYRNAFWVFQMKIESYGNRELMHMGKLELHTGEVHIWKLRWRELETFWEWHKPLLEKEEYQKVKHYHFYEDQMRYLTGKIAVRMLLKEYSGVDKIVLRKGKYGKLYWKAPPGQKEITFNLSHSGEWVLTIFACQQAVGIDVQKIGEIPEYMEIAEKFFATEEAAEIREAGNSERFYHYWAAKEAYLKALGIGLNRGMGFFSVRGNRIIENGKVKSGWKLYPILIKDYAAYAAVQEKGR